MKNITKCFSKVVANDSIDIAIKEGTVHAILGENGAGKTTLMKILYGLLQPDKGNIFIKGKKVTINSPLEAKKLGIGMVHQHFMLISNFTVLENIILGDELTTYGFISFKKAKKELELLSKRYGLYVDLDLKVQNISVGMQQRIEILKTLYHKADILIFDEPTAVLTPQEIKDLLFIMRSLAKENKTIIFITHKIKEIMLSCDYVTIIRQGKNVATFPIEDVDEKKLASLMVGREISFVVNKREDISASNVCLRVKDLTVEKNGLKLLNSLNLDVNFGEIVGIAGVEGNGQEELIAVLTGLCKAKGGFVSLAGKNITNHTVRNIIELGVGYIPEDRHKRGLVLDFSLSENLILQTYYKKPYCYNFFLNFPYIHSYARKLLKDYDVRCESENVIARFLSGGNQQKVVIAREINRNPYLLIAAQPTRGLDIGAIDFIHRKIIDYKNKGKAVLLISLELDEILRLSDRIAVMHGGKIAGWLDPKTATDEELGILMSGGKRRLS